ncbi:MAG: alpha/beta fold hydrolase [Caldilineales bacterium]|nr:alpha/beta fold hydrolase [Caldilineales bacterium]
MSPKSEIKKNSKSSRPGSGLPGLLLMAASGWILYSKFLIDHARLLPKAIPADLIEYHSPSAGRLGYYVDRTASGRPLALIHSLNAATSSYEMRPLFGQYRDERPVYALDLPGFGFSERTPRRYTPDLYAGAIIDFLESQVGEPADVVALSLGCEFVARSALSRPDLFHSLTFISPSGFGSGRRSGRIETGRGESFAYRLLSQPLWGQAIFDLIASRPSLKFFLERSFENDIAPGMLDYAFATSHQPGAHHAPLYFVSGELFTRNAVDWLYRRLELPVLVLYDQDFYVNFDLLPQVSAKPNWQLQRIAPTRGLPQFEMLAETAAAMDTFWQGLG